MHCVFFMGSEALFKNSIFFSFIRALDVAVVSPNPLFIPYHYLLFFFFFIPPLLRVGPSLSVSLSPLVVVVLIL